ncbi:MAG: hypothetical protein HDT20_00055 [Oscillibacter sp.]|nr:hypothetical protein [Oscillibacter sp.]
MQTTCKALSAAYVAACVVCGLFYLIVGFGKAIVGQYALVLLAATIVLTVSLIRNHGRVSGLAKTIIVMIIISQMPIMACWVIWYPGVRVLALLIHSAFCILGIGCLVLAQVTQTDPASQQQI